MSAHFRFTVPPLEVGDRVKHVARDIFGYVEHVNGDVVTVNFAGKSMAVGRLGLEFCPTREQKQRAMRLIQRSWKNKKLRKSLGLPRYLGPDK